MEVGQGNKLSKFLVSDKVQDARNLYINYCFIFPGFLNSKFRKRKHVNNDNYSKLKPHFDIDTEQIFQITKELVQDWLDSGQLGQLETSVLKGKV